VLYEYGGIYIVSHGLGAAQEAVGCKSVASLVVLEVARCGPGVVLMWSWKCVHAAD